MPFHIDGKSIRKPW